jgi:hypothetical protein
MTKEDTILECSNDLYRLAKEATDKRWKRELMERAREIGEMRDPVQVIIVLKNLVVDADRRIREMAA